MASYHLLMSFLLVNGALCQHEIFFPRESPTIEPPCVAYDGRPGICRLLVQCATFFAEIAELSRSPCSITQEQNGVCCPPNKQQTRDPGSIVVKDPVIGGNQAITFPKVTPQDLNHACKNSLTKIENRIVFTQDLVDRNIIAPPNTPVFWHSRLFETTNEIFKKGQDATVVEEASKDLMKNFELNKEQAETGLPNFSVLGTIISKTCPPSPRCQDAKFGYRTMDGSCNNIEHTNWGKTGESFTRMVLQEYTNGISEPRLSTSKGPLPSPRLVSVTVAPAKSDIYNNLTILIWQWGQFLDHDITHTPISKGSNKADISCCSRGQVRKDSDLHPECMPIDIAQNDKFYSKFNQRCMEFVRSMPAIRPECKFGPREQMNQITSYIDGSNVYGSTDKEAAPLREFQGGLLKVNMHQGRELLPGNDSNVGCVGSNVIHKCFMAGDTRVNEQPDLAVMHTVFMRQHNKVVRGLAQLNPGWSDEVLYQEGRRIVSAQLQHITYNEYLPIVLGRVFMETFGLLPLKKGHFRGYRNDVDATIMNSFATAAFRYGHTLITDHIQGFGKFGNLKDDFEISKFQFLPFALYQPDTLDSLIRGLSLQQSQKFDRFFSEQLTNKLFAQSRDFGLDLVALNLQRGRDHGLAPYTKWREACALPVANSWEDLLQEMEPEVINQLKSIYESVDDIDLFIGGIAERIISGSLLGPTFLCIVGRQFIKLKIGDRFYYENGGNIPQTVPGDIGEPLSSFTEGQLKEIRKTSLARILCDNSDNVELMQPLAFVTAHLANKRAVCKTDILIPRMSLDPWKNSRVWTQ